MRWRLLVIASVGLLLGGAEWVDAEVVQVVSATGDLAYHSQMMSSPVPGWCYWTHEATEGPSFHATEADAEGSFCEHDWLVHCDGDSISFTGQWPACDWPFLLFNFYDVTLTCEVTLTEPTRLFARGHFVGRLSQEEHSATLILPDGTSTTVFSPTGEYLSAEFDLAPGTYGVELRVEVWDSAPVDPYDGGVVLRWSLPDETPVEKANWSAVKARFR